MTPTLWCGGHFVFINHFWAKSSFGVLIKPTSFSKGDKFLDAVYFCKMSFLYQNYF